MIPGILTRVTDGETTVREKYQKGTEPPLIPPSQGGPDREAPVSRKNHGRVSLFSISP